MLPSLLREADAATLSAPARLGRGMPFDNGWRFHRGSGDRFQTPSLEDSDWRTVDLPHDWSIEDVPGGKAPDQIGPFSKTAAGGLETGFTVGGEGWYRKHFRLNGLPKDSRVEVLFDGIYEESEVWLNGEPVGQYYYGYAPFAVDLTPALNRDGDNVLAVRVRNLGKNSRWYSGSGIYRQVTLDVLPGGARFARWGLTAWTRRIENGNAQVEVSTKLEDVAEGDRIVARLRDPSGRVVAETSASAISKNALELNVKDARLWSPSDPHLYRLEAELRRGDAVLDQVAEQTGLRIVTMSARAGLKINGERLILRGGSIHHDNGLLGACAYADADERRVRLLKARGYNAVRSAHNVASRTLREACDRVGMLLIDETFDMWHRGKHDEDYSKHFREDWQRPLTAMVLAGRNSPSVIMWSIGNEIPDRSTPEGIEWSWKLANTVRTLDPTRPVTAGLHGLLGPLVKPGTETARPGTAGVADNAAAVFLDVAGYNYRLDEIETDQAAHPNRIVYGSETFAKDAYDYAKLAESKPYILGEFLWTAMDYLGEAGVGAAANVGSVAYYLPGWPWVNAWCGDIDLIGNRKAPSRYRDVVWGLSKLEIAVQAPVPEGQHEYVSNWGWSDERQSWSWPGTEGKPLAVRVYSPGDRVEVLLNGSKVGEVRLTSADKMRGEVKVPYAPGVLEAVAYAGGREIGRRRLETVSAPAELRLSPEQMRMGPSRQDLAFVNVEVLDAQGRAITNSDTEVSLQIEGPAELIGFGSGNPHAVGSFQALNSRTFRGRALAILRGTGKPGSVRLIARAEGLQSAKTALTAG